MGRPHGRDGSFYVEQPSHDLPVGLELQVGALATRIERRGGTDARPLLRVEAVKDRGQAAGLRDHPLLVQDSGVALEPDEWLVTELVGCEVPGVGVVTRVVAAPSCDLLEVGTEEVLIPFVSDAVTRIDIAARRIEVDLAFLGLDGGAAQG